MSGIGDSGDDLQALATARTVFDGAPPDAVEQGPKQQRSEKVARGERQQE